MTGAPHAPWVLEGESIVGVARWPGRRAWLPREIDPLPGPALVMATAFASSPVGPFVELVVAQPARLGLRVGWCQSCCVVDSGTARLGARLNWGFPHQLGTLVWTADGDTRELRWSERGLVVRGRGRGPALPWLLPLRALQQRGDGPVVVSRGLRGRGRLAVVEIDAAGGPDDGLEELAGRHRGVVVGSLRYRLFPARSPRGATATFAAPLRAPEPAVP